MDSLLKKLKCDAKTSLKAFVIVTKTMKEASANGYVELKCRAKKHVFRVTDADSVSCSDCNVVVPEASRLLVTVKTSRVKGPGHHIDALEAVVTVKTKSVANVVAGLRALIADTPGRSFRCGNIAGVASRAMEEAGFSLVDNEWSFEADKQPKEDEQRGVSEDPPHRRPDVDLELANGQVVDGVEQHNRSDQQHDSPVEQIGPVIDHVHDEPKNSVLNQRERAKQRKVIEKRCDGHESVGETFLEDIYEKFTDHLNISGFGLTDTHFRFGVEDTQAADLDLDRDDATFFRSYKKHVAAVVDAVCDYCSGKGNKKRMGALIKKSAALNLKNPSIAEFVQRRCLFDAEGARRDELQMSRRAVVATIVLCADRNSAPLMSLFLDHPRVCHSRHHGYVLDDSGEWVSASHRYTQNIFYFVSGAAHLVYYIASEVPAMLDIVPREMWDADLVKLGKRVEHGPTPCHEYGEEDEPVSFARFVSEMVGGCDGPERRRGVVDLCLAVAKSGQIRQVLGNRSIKEFLVDEMTNGVFVSQDENVEDAVAEIAALF